MFQWAMGWILDLPKQAKLSEMQPSRMHAMCISTPHLLPDMVKQTEHTQALTQ